MQFKTTISIGNLISVATTSIFKSFVTKVGKILNLLYVVFSFIELAILIVKVTGLRFCILDYFLNT